MSDFNGLLDALGKVAKEFARLGLDQLEPAELTVGPIQPGLLNREQAAAYICVGTSSFDKLRTAKAFPEYGTPGYPRWRRLVLDRWILIQKAKE